MTAQFFRDLVARCDAMQREQHLTDAQMAERGGMRREQFVRARSKGRTGIGDVETQTAAAFARIAGAVIVVTAAAPTIDLNAAPVEALGLSARADRALTSAGIVSVSSLLDQTAGDLLMLRGFGPGCLSEVETTLAAHGLSLAGGAA